MITGITLIVAIVLFFTIVFLLHLVKQYLIEENSKIDEDMLHPIVAIFIWNMYVLAAELWAITTTCSTELLPFSVKITLFVMLVVYFMTRVLQCLRELGMKTDLAQVLQCLREFGKKRDRNIKILIINFLIQWNLFLSVEFFIASVVPAALLAYAYPLQVLAITSLLITGLIFYVLFWAVSLRTLYERVLKDCQGKLPPKIFLKTRGVICKFLLSSSFFLFNYAGGVLLTVTLLAILGIGILKGEGNIHGPLFSFLPSGVFFVLSWLTHRFNTKKKKEDGDDSESKLEDGCNRSEQTRARNNTLEGYVIYNEMTDSQPWPKK